jgi:cyclopropane-fatty-acyl-phospholipid synthase
MRRAGLSDRVEIKLQDYRDERGVYDGIASIEMFEAVGEKYWPVYFENLRDRLKPGANATLQIITVEDRRWEVYKRGVDFIQKFIFPGGMLPCPSVLRAEVAKAGLTVAQSVEFGKSYSQTLRRWHETFNARWDEIALLGFDDRFQRMWNFYLTSCAATFESGNCDVTQITVRSQPEPCPPRQAHRRPSVRRARVVRVGSREAAPSRGDAGGPAVAHQRAGRHSWAGGSWAGRRVTRCGPRSATG